MNKILISIIFIYTLTSNSYSAELKDCSVYKKLNPKYLACKTANFAKDTKNFQSTKWSSEKSDKVIKKDQI